jgi:hypothetical protein
VNYIAQLTDPSTKESKFYGPFGTESAAMAYGGFFAPHNLKVWPLHEVGVERP